ncbi:MAG: hypothetical protein ACFFDN_23020 [Candidatus Hodarchaeota archaeon]
MKIEITGKLSAGYYNDMEAGYPVFIDGDSLSDVVKEKLDEMGLDSNFCYEPFGSESDVENPLIGKRVKMILEIEDCTHNKALQIDRQTDGGD